jgi:hypothetical protein
MPASTSTRSSDWPIPSMAGPFRRTCSGRPTSRTHQQYWEARAATAVIPLAPGTHTITPFWQVTGASGKNASIAQRCMTVQSVANQ